MPPPIIQVPKFPTSLNQVIDDVKAVVDVIDDVKQCNCVPKVFLILYVRDLDDEEKKEFENFGSVVYYDQIRFAGFTVDQVISNLKPDYIMIDLRIKEHKTFFSQIDNLDVFHTVAILSKIHKNNFAIEMEDVVDNVIYKLPQVQPFKIQFDKALLSKHISVPGVFSSCLSCGLNFFSSQVRK